MLQHISISWQKSYKDGLLLGQCEVGLNLKAWESAIPSLGRAGRGLFVRHVVERSIAAKAVTFVLIQK